MLTFEVTSKELVEKILKEVSLIQFAESLGGVETLITYPITQTHADVPPEILAKNGINDRVLRLSVGIENAEDLINDFKRVCQRKSRGNLPSFQAVYSEQTHSITQRKKVH